MISYYTYMKEILKLTNNLLFNQYSIIPRLHRAKWSGLWSGSQSTCDIHCSLQQSASHCCSLFSHCYIAIDLLYGLKSPRLLSRSSIYKGKKFLDLDRYLDNFAPSKQGINLNLPSLLYTKKLFKPAIALEKTPKAWVSSTHFTSKPRSLKIHKISLWSFSEP